MLYADFGGKNNTSICYTVVGHDVKTENRVKFKSKYSLATLLFGMICMSFAGMSIRQSECDEEKVLWLVSDTTFKDTIIQLKNYSFQDDTRRIICNDFRVSRDLSELVWNSKYLQTRLRYQERLNFFSIVEFKAVDHNSVIASYYISDRETKETLEMTRLKIINGKIESINPFPGIHDIFIKIDDYDNQDFHME